MQQQFNNLREKHPVFIYEKYEIIDGKNNESVKLKFHFRLGEEILFYPTWEFKKKHVEINYENEEVVNELAFNLGMVELISYWKCSCSPSVIVKAGVIDEEQIKWWKNQYYLGLGEFFYTNKIETSEEDFMKIEVNCESKGKGTEDKFFRAEFEKTGSMIPIGGGKDSVVTLELLSDRKSTNLCFMINDKEASERCALIAGYSKEEILVVHRSLDKKLLELNKEGYLNGHTPFSAIVAFSSVLAAYLMDKQYVVLSNEASANESTIEGTEVNHQYSKSFKFESDFVNYENRYVNSGVHYFSLLRPFSELQIAKFFAMHDKYYKIFRSCNVGSKSDKWCGHCPKCLFVYIILSPFINMDQLVEIFGNDMLNDVSMLETFEKLIGTLPEKPFECVGTCDEANTAICMTIDRLQEEGSSLPKLYSYYKEQGFYQSFQDRENPYLKYYNEENQVPAEFVSRIKELML